MITYFKLGWLKQRIFFTINELIKRDKNHNIILCEATKSNRFGFDNNQLHGDFRQEQERGNSSI